MRIISWLYLSRVLPAPPAACPGGDCLCLEPRALCSARALLGLHTSLLPNGTEMTLSLLGCQFCATLYDPAVSLADGAWSFQLRAGRKETPSLFPEKILGLC